MGWIYYKENNFWSHIDLALKSRSFFQLCDFEKLLSLSLQGGPQWSLFPGFYTGMSPPMMDIGLSDQQNMAEVMVCNFQDYIKRLQLLSRVLWFFLRYFGSQLWTKAAAMPWVHLGSLRRGPCVKELRPANCEWAWKHVSASVKLWAVWCPGWQIVTSNYNTEIPNSAAVRFLTIETICYFKLLYFRGNLLGRNRY